MPGLFQSLEIGRRALLTSQLQLQTNAHNIANVDTPGYTRQRVNINTTFPENSTVGAIGSGVGVRDIQHIRDMFLGTQYRQENKSLGEWTYKEKVFTQIESVFNEPNDNTLADQMNNFWNAWDDFSKGPDSSTRDQLISQTTLMTNAFHDMSDQITNLRDSIDSDLMNYGNEINRMTQEIAQLNHQIKKIEIAGTVANDLRDARDLVIDQLSQYIDVNTNENQSGEMIVYIGAMSIVNGEDAIPLEIKIENDNGVPIHQMYWEGTDVKISNASGELKALLESRDEIIPKYIDRLNTLARTIVEQVNTLHVTGQTANGDTGIEFFNSGNVDAFNISLNNAIKNDHNNIVSSTSGAESDNTLALEITNLRNKGVLNNGNTSISEYYTSIVGSIGVETNESTSFSTNYKLVVEQIEFQRQSIQGVSLDEEMAEMIQYQHAYEAAARVITAIDQALDTLISGMGIVGR